MNSEEDEAEEDEPCIMEVLEKKVTAERCIEVANGYFE